MRDGRIIADPERGVILSRKKKVFKEVPNWCGYLRFRFRVKRRGKWINAWFFTHKAIFLAENPKLKKGFEIDHIDFDPTNNRRSNLRYIPVRDNMKRKNPNTNDAPPAF